VLIPLEILQASRPVVFTLAGAGCAPCIFEAAHTPGITWQPVDWFKGEGAFDPASIAKRLADELALRQGPSVLAGHSLGAFIALLIALRHPSSVQGLILSNTGARMLPNADFSLPDRIRTQWHAENQRAFLRACFEAEPPAGIWARMCDYLACLPAERMLAAVEGLRRMDVLAELGQVQCPTLIAHGRYDRKRTEQSARELAEGIAGAQIAWLPAGHTPMVECPDAYRVHVHRFLTDAGWSRVDSPETP